MPEQPSFFETPYLILSRRLVSMPVELLFGVRRAIRPFFHRPLLLFRRARAFATFPSGAAFLTPLYFYRDSSTSGSPFHFDFAPGFPGPSVVPWPVIIFLPMRFLTLEIFFLPFPRRRRVLLALTAPLAGSLASSPLHGRFRRQVHFHSRVSFGSCPLTRWLLGALAFPPPAPSLPRLTSIYPLDPTSFQIGQPTTPSSYYYGIPSHGFCYGARRSIYQGRWSLSWCSVFIRLPFFSFSL